MTTTLAPHAVRIGHTTPLNIPLLMPLAVCCDRDPCEFCATDHVQEKGVAHARQAGHDVLVGEGRALTRIEVTS